MGDGRWWDAERRYWRNGQGRRPHSSLGGMAPAEFSGWLYGLDRVFSRAERGELLVEVRNCRHLPAMGRMVPRPKGPRLDPALLPLGALERLIQCHPDRALADVLHVERQRRLDVSPSFDVVYPGDISK